jgi:hypothetical protein
MTERPNGGVATLALSNWRRSVRTPNASVDLRALRGRAGSSTESTVNCRLYVNRSTFWVGRCLEPAGPKPRPTWPSPLVLVVRRGIDSAATWGARGCGSRQNDARDATRAQPTVPRTGTSRVRPARPLSPDSRPAPAWAHHSHTVPDVGQSRRGAIDGLGGGRPTLGTPPRSAESRHAPCARSPPTSWSASVELWAKPRRFRSSDTRRSPRHSPPPRPSLAVGSGRTSTAHAQILSLFNENVTLTVP